MAPSFLTKYMAAAQLDAQTFDTSSHVPRFASSLTRVSPPTIFDSMRRRAWGIVPNDVRVLSTDEPDVREAQEPEYWFACSQRTPDDHEHDGLSKQCEAESVEEFDQEDSDSRNE